MGNHISKWLVFLSLSYCYAQLLLLAGDSADPDFIGIWAGTNSDSLIILLYYVVVCLLAILYGMLMRWTFTKQ